MNNDGTIWPQEKTIDTVQNYTKYGNTIYGLQTLLGWTSGGDTELPQQTTPWPSRPIKAAVVNACVCMWHTEYYGILLLHSIVYCVIRIPRTLCQGMCLYVTYWVLWNTTVTQYRILCHTNSPANAEGEGESSWLVTPVPRTLSGSWNLTCARCQHQATATEACNWSSGISWPSRWSPVSFCHLCRPKSCQYNVDILFLLSK